MLNGDLCYCGCERGDKKECECECEDFARCVHVCACMKCVTRKGKDKKTHPCIRFGAKQEGKENDKKAEEKGERPERRGGGGRGTQGTRLSNWRASGCKRWLPERV